MEISQEGNLAKAVTKGIGSLGIGTVLANLVRLGALAVLARHLSAADFGIAALSVVLVRFGQESAAFGLETTIIQKKDMSADEVNACFWGGLLFAGVLFGVYVGMSPLLAYTLRIPSLTAGIRLASLVIPVTCLGMIPRALLERRMAYSRVATYEALGQMSGDVSAILLALNGFAFWSLIAGFVLAETVKTSCFWMASRWYPTRFSVEIRNAWAWRFGFYVTTDRLLTYLSINMDRIIIGSVLGASAVGYYVLAFEMIIFPTKRFSSLVARVLFPALSHVQDKAAASADFYLKAIRYVSILTVPPLIGLAVVAPEISRLIYGPKAIVVAPLLRLLCPAGIVMAILTPMGSVIYSKGRPDINAKWSLGTAIATILAVTLGSLGGIYWAAAAVGIVWICLFPVNQAIVTHLTGVPLVKAYKSFLPAAVAGTCVALAALSVKFLISHFRSVGNEFSLATQVAAAGIIFILFLWTTERRVISPLLAMAAGRVGPVR